MDEAIEDYYNQGQETCQRLQQVLAEWKQKVLDDLRERDEYLNLQEQTCRDVPGAADSFGDGCDWYVGRSDSCGNYDHEGFTASLACCACGGGLAPEWFLDLDYDQADEYARDLEAAYVEHHQEVAGVITRWQQARNAVDQQYW